MQSLMRTIEQERAKYAWNCVQTCVEQAINALNQKIAQERDEKKKRELQKRLQSLQSDEGREEWKKKYGSLSRRVPSLILTNGLGQTLAFLKAKGRGEPGDEHIILFENIGGWLKKRLDELGSCDDVLEWIIGHANSQKYRLATMEALAFLQWLKRFAEAILPKEGEER